MNTYSELDIIFLKEYYPKYGARYCANNLDRDLKSIQSKVRKLDLKYSGIKYEYSKEYLEPFIKESKNFTDLMNKLGRANSGTARKFLKKYIDEQNISIEHFKQDLLDRQINFSHNIKKIPISEILVENSTYNSSSNLKDRLYKEGFKIKCCELCGQTEEWRGKRMSLILDHKNGVHNDNRIENLQIVCPNCNATLDTHCRGSKKLENKINKEKLNDKKFKDRVIGLRKVERPPYEDLIAEIEINGFVSTGNKYGVSDNAIRRWVKTYEKYGY